MNLLVAICATVRVFARVRVVSDRSGRPALPRLREPPVCLLAARSDLQAQLAVARLAQQAPAATHSSLMLGNAMKAGGAPRRRRSRREEVGPPYRTA